LDVSQNPAREPALDAVLFFATIARVSGFGGKIKTRILLVYALKRLKEFIKNLES
jgi:hypothetical protein